jgi:cytidine deaminase
VSKATSSLSLELRAELVAMAHVSQARAYARYSGYAVGAAVLTEDGRIFGGCNVENAMYGATVCAERVAIFSAIAAGAKRITALAVVTPGGGSPCGFCRQVLSEFADADTPVILLRSGDQKLASAPPREFKLGELLPYAWGRADLDEP